MEEVKLSRREKQVKNKVKEYMQEHPQMVLEAVLESHFRPPCIQVGRMYFASADDTDGGIKGLAVTYSGDGDMWTRFDDPRIFDDLEGKNLRMEFNSLENFQSLGMPHSLRYRMPLIGGGRNQHVHAALKVLAFAISQNPTEIIELLKDEG